MYSSCRRSICRISCTMASWTADTVNVAGTEQRFRFITSLRGRAHMPLLRAAICRGPVSMVFSGSDTGSPVAVTKRVLASWPSGELAELFKRSDRCEEWQK